MVDLRDGLKGMDKAVADDNGLRLCVIESLVVEHLNVTTDTDDLGLYLRLEAKDYSQGDYHNSQSQGYSCCGYGYG